MRSRAALVVCALLAALALSPPRSAQAQGFVDPCLQCGKLYSSDGSGRLYLIDQDAGTSTFVGNHGTTMFDIAASADGRLLGVTGFGQYAELSACTAAQTPRGFSSGFVNGLAGDVISLDLYGQGPPLQRVETTGFTSTVVGGTIGPDPPDWCGSSSGDLAMSPLDGMLYSAIGCFECGSDRLIQIDPASGFVTAEIGCFTDAVTGARASGVFGLAFDEQCRLWGALSFGSNLLLIDPTNATFTTVPVTGGFNGTYGMASIACPGVICGATGGDCAPRNHGAWHRTCLGWNEIDPGRSGGGNGPGVHPHDADLDVAIAAAVDGVMAPYGLGACEALDEGPFSDECLAALRELATLELNLRAQMLALSCPVELHPVMDGDGLTVREARAEMQRLLALGDGDSCKDARWIGEHVNNGEALYRLRAAAYIPTSGRAAKMRSCSRRQKPSVMPAT